MRKPFFCIVVIFVSYVFLYGCSRQEAQQPQRSTAVVKGTIAKPSPVKAPAPAPEEKKSSVPVAPAEAKKPDENLKSGATGPEEANTEKPLIQAPAMGMTKPALVEAGAKASPPSEVQSPGQSKRYYAVEKGDTLASIAGKKEIYGDRLKWVVLYRLNAEILEPLPASDNLPDLPLPNGMSLKIITPEEMKANLERRSGGIWVVNALSAKSNAELIPAVVSLIKNNYPVYLMTARVNERDWTRVRIGFFKSKEEAEAAGKKIMGIMSFQDSWVVKLSKAEFAENAVY